MRIGDSHCDQVVSTGFETRLDDLDRLAALGVRRVRMPVLWERTERGDGTLDFGWADARMQRLQQLGVQPIVGLLHHGSGPRRTDLLDAAFPALLAGYAAAVAERYPWVGAWTPVNEPLTTARFSGLYGLWFPHRRDDAAFVRALLNQIQGTRLAMQRIRAVIPTAELVQTEDLGRVAGTRRLASQVRFENDRRWLSLDLLTGGVTPEHPLWPFLVTGGADPSELHRLADEPTPPGIVGINHYVTSDRFLDHRIGRYPSHVHAANCEQAYADVEAVRVRGSRIGGFHARLREASLRYGLPLAITEAQMGCTREEQLRWFHEAWMAAERLRRGGTDVRAVAAWAAFGAHDWDSLLTEQRGRYESGLFDVRGTVPRPTALAGLARYLAGGGAGGLADGAAGAHAGGPASGPGSEPQREPQRELENGFERELQRGPANAPAFVPTDPSADATASLLADGTATGLHLHPVLQSPGWWHRAERHAYPPHGAIQVRPAGGAPVLITGARGTLGQAHARACRQRGLPYVLLGRGDVDIADPESVQAAFERWRPWAVVNTAGYVRVDDAEDDPRQWRDNAEGPCVLAAACRERGVRLATFSSDLVFDGGRTSPYRESDAARPLNAYGRAKRHAEQALDGWPGVLVVRTAAFFGPWDGHNFVTRCLQTLQRGDPWPAIGDQTVSPTCIVDLVGATLDLLIDGEHGIWHLVNDGVASWFELACTAAEIAGLPRSLVHRIDTAAAAQRAPRPAYSALASARGSPMPTLATALSRHVREAGDRRADPPPASAYGCGPVAGPGVADAGPP